MPTLVDSAVGYGDRSLRFAAPAGWTRRTALRTTDRTRIQLTEPGGDILVLVEISNATRTDPLAAARWNERQHRGEVQYVRRRLDYGPADGATWEYSYIDSRGRFLVAVDWFATVGSTDVALFVSAPRNEWSAAQALWSRMVDSVRPGDSPPGNAGPANPTATSTSEPSFSPQPSDTPTGSAPTSPVIGSSASPTDTPPQTDQPVGKGSGGGAGGGSGGGPSKGSGGGSGKGDGTSGSGPVPASPPSTAPAATPPSVR